MKGHTLKKLLIPAIFTFLAGCFHNPSAANTPGEYYDMFAQVWEIYEADYPEFTSKNVDWKELFYIYSPLAAQAESAEELMMEVVLPMLGELRDSHVNTYVPGHGATPTYSQDIQKNYHAGVLLANYLQPAGFTGWVNSVGYCIPESLPYLSINGWGTGTDTNAVKNFIELCIDEPAIILDVRMNGGGNSTLIGSVSGMFTDNVEQAWIFRSRNGPGYDDVYNIIVNTHPNGNTFYSGIVYLLIGEYSASACEGFILHMSNLDNVVMLGDTTWGAVNCPYKFELSNGCAVNAISWTARTVDNEVVESVGIAPDIYVEATEEDFAQGIDPVLEYAIDLVNSQPE